MLSIRYKVLIAFIFICLVSLYLGFANISLPHDKWFHFTMFFLMTLGFYWTIETDHLWKLRGVTFLVCTIFGAIGSEFAQHFISPFRQFDKFDILANICGSITAIIGSGIYNYYTQVKNKYTEIALQDIV